MSAPAANDALVGTGAADQHVRMESARTTGEHGMQTFQQDAALMLLGLRFGLQTANDAIQWADEQIAVREQPGEALIELALTRPHNIKQVASTLRQLAGDTPSIHVLPRALGAWVDELRNNPRLGPHVARVLFEICIEVGYDLPDELRPMAGFDDAYALAGQGIYGTEAEVFDELVQFAVGFAETPGEGEGDEDCS